MPTNFSFNILFIICSIILFLGYTTLVIYLLKRNKQILRYTENNHELEHEKHLRTSISKLTHELKNPIAVCNGYLQMLNLEDKEKAERYFNIIRSEISRSLTVINDFSTYQKLKKVDKEEMDINYLLEEINDTLSPLFKKNNATLEINTKEDVYICADYNKLKQVFINLLKNTLEAKKKNRFLKVIITIREFKYKIRIRIKDNGIGMDKYTLNHIYDIFYTTKQDGTGIGTNYSKEVIELHQGTIKYKSIVNKGTEVVIELPKEKSLATFSNKN